MLSRYLTYAARKPRYDSASGKARVQVEQILDGRPRLIDAELQNLSRSGYQVKTAVAIDPQEPITLRVCVDGSPTPLTLPGRVRWQLPVPDGAWLTGCQTDQLLSWETLGELFLSGVLAP